MPISDRIVQRVMDEVRRYLEVRGIGRKEGSKLTGLSPPTYDKEWKSGRLRVCRVGIRTFTTPEWIREWQLAREAETRRELLTAQQQREEEVLEQQRKKVEEARRAVLAAEQDDEKTQNG